MSQVNKYDTGTGYGYNTYVMLYVSRPFLKCHSMFKKTLDLEICLIVSDPSNKSFKFKGRTVNSPKRQNE